MKISALIFALTSFAAAGPYVSGAATLEAEKKNIRGCPDGEQLDKHTGKCVAVSCKSSNACEDYEICIPKDITCVRSPCPQFECEYNCPQVLCAYPFPEDCKPLLDENGCSTCQCQCPEGQEYVPSTGECKKICPQIRCAHPFPEECKPIFNDGCPTCQCQCQNDDEKYDSSTGKCVPKCYEVKPCPEGSKPIFDDNGCATGKCQCPKGETFIYDNRGCVPVSCDSPNACKPHQICEPIDIECVTWPCPKFECKPKCPLVKFATCPDGSKPIFDDNGCATGRCQCPKGEEFDYEKRECVPVSCDSPNACEDDKICRPSRQMCIQKPCQDFICECAPVLCKKQCDHGWAVNDKGCEICECAWCERVTCEMYCEYGRAQNEKGCEICQCAPKPDCEPLKCDLACNEFAKNEKGCDICECAK